MCFKLLINFDCVTQGEWNGAETKPAKDAVQAFKQLRKMGYGLYLIEVPETEEPVSYGYKPIKEKYMAEKIIWNVHPEVSEKDGVSFVIEQGSLKYRGTWLTVTAKKVDGKWQKLLDVVKKFCKDYGIDSRRELSFVFPYDLTES